MTGWVLQKAVYGRLRTDPALKTLIGDPPRVHDDAPAHPVFPYVRFADARATPLFGVPGAIEHDIRLAVHSRYEGRREISDILKALYDALHEADLTLDAGRLVSLRFVFGDIFHRQEANIYSGLARFRAVTEA